MNQALEKFIEQIATTGYLEWTAVVLAILYLILAVKENSWCWPAAFVSTAIYIFLFFDVNLYMESFLNLYYLLMAIYGWYQWKKVTDNQPQKTISTWEIYTHIKLITVTFLLVFSSAYLLNRLTNQDFALFDSFTTWFAVLATYMVTQKVLENWLYWIVIDTVSIYLYLSKGLTLTAVLFMAYIVLAIVGWFSWKQHYENATAK